MHNNVNYPHKIVKMANFTLYMKCVCSLVSDFSQPHDCNLPDSSVHGILQARILEWVAFPFSRRSSQPRDQTCVSCTSCIGRQVLYHCTTRKARGWREVARWTFSAVTPHQRPTSPNPRGPGRQTQDASCIVPLRPVPSTLGTCEPTVISGSGGTQ